MRWSSCQDLKLAYNRFGQWSFFDNTNRPVIYNNGFTYAEACVRAKMDRTTNGDGYGVAFCKHGFYVVCITSSDISCNTL